MENEKIDKIEKAGQDFMEAIADLRPFMNVAIAAREFIHDGETWESYQELQTSNSAAIPPYFMALGDAVTDAFGPPAFSDEDEPDVAPIPRTGPIAEPTRWIQTGPDDKRDFEPER